MVALRQISGGWDRGVVLDKHTVRSTYLGEDDNGYPQFNTLRTTIGDALYQLKYRGDWNQVAPLADEIIAHGVPAVGPINVVVPMPASTARSRQPVSEIARAVAQRLGVPCDEALLVKAPTPQLKNLGTREEKDAVLADAITVGRHRGGPWDVLLVDDLYHTGASVDATCKALRSHPDVRRIGVVVLTWR